MSLFKALFNRRWWWVTILVLVMMVLLARLGFWQLDRLEQRRAANAEIAAALDASPLKLNGIKPDEVGFLQDTSQLKNRLASGTGTFDHEQQVLLKVQNWGYRAGVNLITPLVLDDGSTAVLVDRGWIPDTEAGPEARTAFDVPGAVAVDGYVALSQELEREAAVKPQGPQSEVYRVDIPALQAQMPYTLLPFYVVQAPQNNNEQLPYRLERQVDLSEGNHLSYALQWFIFSIGLGIAYLIFVYRNTQKST